LKAPLGDIAKVRTGIAFREAIRHVEGGDIAIVQAGDIGADGIVDTNSLLRVAGLSAQGEAAFLLEGEVLLQSRGQSYRAAVVPAHALPMVPTASVLVIKPSHAIRAAYLAEFLNDPATQAELRKLSTGATIANLKKSAVEQLEVLVPALEDQDKIVGLAETLRQISRIEVRLAELRRIELRLLIEKLAEKNRGRVNAAGS